MAKGKQRETVSEESTDDRTLDESPTTGSPPDPLAAEVAAFLTQRTTLAARIAEEIAATESRLAELRRTLSMLMPESSDNSGGKERRPKKAKPKEPARTTPPNPAANDGTPSGE